MTGKATHVLGNFLQPRSKGQPGGGCLPSWSCGGCRQRSVHLQEAMSRCGFVLLFVVCFYFSRIKVVLAQNSHREKLRGSDLEV